MKITLGFSPCPNDTFIFDALINNKIDTEISNNIKEDIKSVRDEIEDLTGSVRRK